MPTVQDLMGVLYDPAKFASLFGDVQHGQNTLYDDTCCFAGHGYDLTTGLGQLDFTELAVVLAEHAQRPIPVVVPPAFTG